MEYEKRQNSYDYYALHQVFRNYNTMHFGEPLKSYIILIYLFIALGLTWLFLWFEFAAIKSLLISIPVAGVLIIINFLIVIFSYSGGYGNFDEMILSSFTITFFLIISLTGFALKTKKMKKRILNILVNLCYIISPFFIMFGILLYNQKTKYVQILNVCTGRMEETRIDSFLIEPYFFFFYALIGILLFLPILKKWKAYEE